MNNLFQKESFENIPKNWSIQRMKNIMSPRDERSDSGKEDLISVTIKNGVIKRSEYLNDEEGGSRAETLIGYKIVKKNDLVNNIMKMSFRCLGISPNDGIVSPAYSVFEINESKVEPSFLNYLLRIDSYVSEYRKLSKGIQEARMRLYDNYFLAMDVIVPTLKEQKLIVQYIDKKTKNVDKIIQNTQKKIKLLKEKKLKLIEIILLNSNTKRIRLRHVVKLEKRSIQNDSDKTFTKIGIYNWGQGIFKYPSEKGSDLGDSSFYFIKEGDLILSGQFSWEGSVAIVKKEENNCIASHRFHILNGKKDKLLNEYLWAYFTSQEGHFLLNENSPGSAGRNRPLNINNLLKEVIPVPDIDVQKKIQRLVILTEKYENYASRQRQLLNEYRQSLITLVVTGKVKITNDML